MSEEKTMSQAKVVELLQGIWGEMKSLNGRIDGVRDELITSRETLSQRIEETNVRLKRGFARMDQRFDQFLVGEHGKEHREFRERITRIEAHAGLPPFTQSD